MKRLLRVVLLCCGLFLFLAADGDNSRYEAVGGKIMCMCGCDQLLLKCNHVGCPYSARMISQLRDNLAKSSNDADVLNFFRREWGVTSVVEPSRHGFELLAWVLPFAGLGTGMLLVVLVARKWKLRPAESRRSEPKPDPKLEELRQRVRRETEL
jgi:cytochrome c-type biogenesis protein CcmH